MNDAHCCIWRARGTENHRHSSGGPFEPHIARSQQVPLENDQSAGKGLGAFGIHCIHVYNKE